MDDALKARLLTAFSQEAEERLQATDGLLVRMEKTVDPEERAEVLAEVFRQVHSLKGAAHAASLPRVASLAHDLETMFGDLRDGRVAEEPDVFDRSYQMLDALKDAVSAGTQAGPVDGPRSAISSVGPQSVEGHAEEHRRLPGVVDPEGGEEPASVRIATEKLDALMVESEELIITHLRAQARVTEAHELMVTMVAWEAQCRNVSRRLRSSRGRSRDDASSSAEVGDLVGFIDQSQAQANEIARSLSTFAQTLDADTRRLAQISSRITGDVRRIRMLPISTVFDVLPRMVRDLARERDAIVDLILEGGETEADRSVLEKLGAVLIHLVRNAIDHGIESPAARLGAGKPAGARLVVRAEARGNNIAVIVSDDGRGVDVDALREAALAGHTISAEEAGTLGDEEALKLAFEPRLSTSAEINDVSGRGVGLDAVRRIVEHLHGSVTLQSTAGAGTTFIVLLPVSVSTITCLLVEAADQIYAVPGDNVKAVVRFDPHEAVRSGGRWVVTVEGSALPLADLGETIHAPDGDTGLSDGEHRYAMALEAADQSAAFLVDKVVSAEDVVVKPLPPPLHQTVAAAGATLLRSGRVAVILNVPELLRASDNIPGVVVTGAGSEERLPPLVLVAEDSFTTRTMEKALLEAAGYRVCTASNGLQALELIQEGGINLLVSDVDMPGLDGFELIMRLRADDRFATLPVVLVTSLDSAAHRKRGADVGADAFIVKSSFDRERLLETIRGLV